MSLGKNERAVFLYITEGKVTRQTDKGTEKYDYLEGLVQRIYSREREFRGEKVPYWCIEVRDHKNGTLYSLGLKATSGVWRSIILSLGSVEDFTKPVKIAPYRKGEYDKISLSVNGQVMDWVSELPPVEQIEVQGQIIKSTAKREQFISGLVESVNEKIKESWGLK